MFPKNFRYLQLKFNYNIPILATVIFFSMKFYKAHSKYFALKQFTI